MYNSVRREDEPQGDVAGPAPIAIRPVHISRRVPVRAASDAWVPLQLSWAGGVGFAVHLRKRRRNFCPPTAAGAAADVLHALIAAIACLSGPGPRLYVASANS